MREAGRRMLILALRSPALLVSLLVVHRDCSNVTDALLRIIREAVCSSDWSPQFVVDFHACFGLLLSTVMLFASEDNLLRLYRVILPVISLILINFAVTQRFLNISCSSQPAPPPTPPPPTDLWSQLTSYLNYIVGTDDSPPPAVELENPSWNCFENMLITMSVIFLLGFTSGLMSFITLASSRVERSFLIMSVNLFSVPCCLKFVGASAFSVQLANTLVCYAVSWGMDIWSVVCLERMLYTSTRTTFQNGNHVGWMLVDAWNRARSSLCVSWLVAFTVQCLDASLQTEDPPDQTLATLMMSTLCYGSWPPMMYLGLCAAVGYLTDAAWKLVYLCVTRSVARLSVTDNGLSELMTLLHARLVCFLLNVSTADMFPFAVPFLTSLLAVRWIFRALKKLLVSADRPTRIRASLVYLAIIVALPCFVCVYISGDKRFHAAGNVLVALRISTRGASTLIQSVVRQWYSSANSDDADNVNFIVTTLAGVLRLCLGCYIVLDLIFIDALILGSVISRPRVALNAPFVGQCLCVALQTYLQAWFLVALPLQRIVDSLQKHYGAAERILSLPKLDGCDQRLIDSCAVCLSEMDADSARLTPCGHAFHGKCLELSLRVSRDCPICRNQLLKPARS